LSLRRPRDGLSGAVQIASGVSAVAVEHKLAVMIHAMLKTGEPFKTGEQFDKSADSAT
jgi:hypothetical protein